VSQSRKRAFCHSGRSEESNEINMLRMKDSSAKDSKWHYDTACILAGKGDSFGLGISMLPKIVCGQATCPTK
jgi:hypothetical protein